MKKLLIILVMLFWCSVVFTADQQQLINQYLSDRKLAPIEGVWSVAYERGTFVILFREKSKGIYVSDMIYSPDGICENAPKQNIIQSSENFYTSTTYELTKSCQQTSNNINWSYSSSTNSGTSSLTFKGHTWNLPMTRLWPNDFISHNAKFKTKEDKQEEEKALVAMVNDAKKTCKVLGFKEESEKFADCTLKLYTQKVDELVAEKKAKALMTQSQTTTTTQSSGSNVTTIYDPVRDSKALMKQGQKMLSGRCTLGVDC
jgi:hypothetical protein